MTITFTSIANTLPTIPARKPAYKPSRFPLAMATLGASAKWSKTAALLAELDGVA